ncbi:hypothetical protein B0H13DRAFT_1927249 [Mycena leptocephala]|nr:hypothetical protein B0H13DRAFT_1927249 [Mycena leptocephala]
MYQRRDKIKMNEIPAALGAGSHQLPHDVLRCNANCTCLARANSRCSTLGDHEEESSSIRLKVDTGKLDSPIYALCRTTTTARTQSVTARREDISGMVGGKGAPARFFYPPLPSFLFLQLVFLLKTPTPISIATLHTPTYPHTIPAHAPRSKLDPTGSMHAQCRHRGDPTLPLRLPAPAFAFDLNFSPGLTPHALKIAYRRPQMRRTRQCSTRMPPPPRHRSGAQPRARCRIRIGDGKDKSRIRLHTVHAALPRLLTDAASPHESAVARASYSLRAGHPSPALWDTGVNAPGRAATAQGKLPLPTCGWCRANTSTPRSDRSEWAAPAPGLAKKAAARRVSACCTAPIDSHGCHCVYAIQRPLSAPPTSVGVGFSFCARCMVHPDSQERACPESASYNAPADSGVYRCAQRIIANICAIACKHDCTHYAWVCGGYNGWGISQTLRAVMHTQTRDSERTAMRNPAI